jgi:cytochrome c556
MTMRLATLAVLSAILLSTPGSSADKPKQNPPNANPLMVEKLKNSQGLLEGLANNDFDKIQKSAEELMRISKAAEWTVHKTPQYEVQTNNFRRAAETIIQKSKAKNLDGATLAYVDMTLTCVRCHQHCREVRDTSFVPRIEE